LINLYGLLIIVSICESTQRHKLLMFYGRQLLKEAWPVHVYDWLAVSRLRASSSL